MAVVGKTRKHPASVEGLEPRRLFALSLPDGFSSDTYAAGINAGTALAFAPDGRLFVTEKNGALRIVPAGGDPSGANTATALTLSVRTEAERGLLGVALGPTFQTDSFVYLYYTADQPAVHNRVSRFTLVGNSIDPASETVLLDLPDLVNDTHNGGALHFGPDGKLYVGVGDNRIRDLAPSLDSPLGKILRINPDGTIPADNPFYSRTTGIDRAIWARGLRNPYTFDFDPRSGRMYINDVGENTYEEINLSAAGADYGWPASEGPTRAPGITAPVVALRHPQWSAIIGGAFAASGFYYFGDFSRGQIATLNPRTNRVAPFATGASLISGLSAGPDGNVYLINYSQGAIERISGNFALPPNTPPTATISAPGLATRYVAGRTLRVTFKAADREDRRLADAGYQATVTRVVGGVESAALLTVTGTRRLSYTIPTDTADLGTDVLYRVTLTVTDSDGATDTATRDYRPLVRTIRLVTRLAGGATPVNTLSATLGGSGIDLPATLSVVAGVRLSLSVPAQLLATRGGGEQTTLTFVRSTGLRSGTSPELDFFAPADNRTIVFRYA